MASVSRVRLMTTPPQCRLSRLTRQDYLAFLEKANLRGFVFATFSRVLPGAESLPESYIVLRHDVDFAPRLSVEMAELEHAAGVHSTYFVLVDG